MIKITKEEYLKLLLAQEEITRLHDGGVNNWEWYGESLNPPGDSWDKIQDEITKKVAEMEDHICE